MELTKFTDYALRTLIYLGLHSDRLVALSEIAEAYAISRNHLVKISHRLAQLGIIETTRGKGGGIRLAKPPSSINVGNVVRSTEGRMPVVECFDAERNSCVISSCCSLKGAIKKAENAFYRELDQHSLADLLKRDAALRAALKPSHSR